MQPAAGLRWILAGAVLAILVALHRVDPSDDVRWLMELHNAGHAVVFGVIALLTLALTGGRSPRAYALALIVTLLLGIASEAAQILRPDRDASLADWFRDAAGAIACLCLAAIWQGAASRSATRLGLFATAVLCVVAVAQPVFATWQDYRGRDAAFPALCCTGEEWDRHFLRTNFAELVVDPPAQPGAPDGFRRIDFQPSNWPGVVIHEVYPDWTGYAALAFDVYVPVETPTRLVLRIDDQHHDGSDYRDRVDRGLPVQPGLNRFRIAMREIEEAPKTRRMDMRRMDKVFFFADRPDQPFSVYWSGFRLLSPEELAETDLQE
jgi:hypothetical protein